ncbi:hypothetical protein BH24DEI2_BH24DEI2_09840 [soil metagenome]
MAESLKMSLTEIGAVASQVYPNSYLGRELARRSEQDEQGHSATEALAAYLAGEFIDLYDPASSDEANVARISASLERSVELLSISIVDLQDGSRQVHQAERSGR